ncbi:MAG TPA: sulfotransferase [Solirubrobacteraceae bacterium]|nr:sulfotransferase [Solirubrobacteraceae bacterium]
MIEPQRSTHGSTAALGSAEPAAARTPSAAPEVAKVVYVMGAGHSGSTILGLALGNCSDSFYAGEVDEWLLVSGKPSLGGAERTRFWDDVREAMRDSGAHELFGGEVNRLIERSSSLLRLDRFSERRAMLRRYRQVSEKLFGAIARTAGASYIVDSSHFPLRARELQRAGGVELYLVLLVRDPQDVVASNVREISRHEVAERRIRILTMNANLWLTQLLSLLVFVRQPRERRVFVRHESFVADPEGVLRQILESLGTEVTPPDLTALRAGVALQGNSLIMSQTIAVERSTRPTARWSRSTELLQSCWRPLLARLRPVATPTPHGSSDG